MKVARIKGTHIYISEGITKDITDYEWIALPEEAVENFDYLKEDVLKEEFDPDASFIREDGVVYVNTDDIRYRITPKGVIASVFLQKDYDMYEADRMTEEILNALKEANYEVQEKN